MFLPYHTVPSSQNHLKSEIHHNKMMNKITNYMQI